MLNADESIIKCIKYVRRPFEQGEDIGHPLLAADTLVATPERIMYDLQRWSSTPTRDQNSLVRVVKKSNLPHRAHTFHYLDPSNSCLVIVPTDITPAPYTYSRLDGARRGSRAAAGGIFHNGRKLRPTADCSQTRLRPETTLPSKSASYNARITSRIYVIFFEIIVESHACAISSLSSCPKIYVPTTGRYTSCTGNS